jgi:hypothetical protein
MVRNSRIVSPARVIVLCIAAVVCPDVPEVLADETFALL